MASAIPARVLLYDGTCGLCHGAVRFLLRRDHDAQLTFAPLQGVTAASLKERYPVIPEDVSTLVLVEDGEVHLRSRAVFRSLRQLGQPWRLLSGLRWLPRSLTDLVYRAVAALRYRLFGRRELCELPSPEQRERFLP